MRERGLIVSGRRAFLRGAGGVTLALPWLEAAQPRRARAAGPPRQVVFFTNVNGVMQASRSKYLPGQPVEPEMFWPVRKNAAQIVQPITSEDLQAALALPRTSADPQANLRRTAGVFAARADKMLFVRGVDHPFAAVQTEHDGGSNQMLNARKPVQAPMESLGGGESMDNLIARELNPAANPRPLNLTWAHEYEYLPRHRVGTYRASADPVIGVLDPRQAYRTFLQQTGAGVGAAELTRLRNSRRSVNDLLRGEVQALKSRADLSRIDRLHLDRHLAAIREIEIAITTTLPPDVVSAMDAMSGRQGLNDSRAEVVRLHTKLIVLALSTGYTRVATLHQQGAEVRYPLPGYPQPLKFHMVSHRIDSDGATGNAILGAVEQHHLIDEIHAREFLSLVDQLAATTTIYGNLLDNTMAVWTNQCAAGDHRFDNVPWVIAGGAGYLKTGCFVDLPQHVKSNKIMNTILNAVGVRKPNGDLVTDFGEPGLEPGELDVIKL